MTAEQEILQQEEQLANAKRMLDLDALGRIYGDDFVMTGVLGEPTCGKMAVLD
jgi:ketosteroid isomerase-like protein